MNQDEPSKERCKSGVKGMGKFVDFLGPIKDYGKMHMMEVGEISQNKILLQLILTSGYPLIASTN
jgi:hypothetical protein